MPKGGLIQYEISMKTRALSVSRSAHAGPAQPDIAGWKIGATLSYKPPECLKAQSKCFARLRGHFFVITIPEVNSVKVHLLSYEIFLRRTTPIRPSRPAPNSHGVAGRGTVATGSDGNALSQSKPEAEPRL